jgi:ADP-heptose:LPS heptosyltransferase
VMKNRILLFDRADNFFALNNGYQNFEGIEWGIGNVQNARKDFLTHNNCSTVIVHSSNPRDLLQLQRTKAKSIWVLPREGGGAEWEANLSELEKALAFAGVVVCTEEQGQQFEALTQVSVTPNISLKKALKSVEYTIAVGVGAGIGNMCKVMPLIQKLSKHFGVVIDVVCNPSVPNSHQLFTQNEWVGKSYGKMHLATYKQYKSVFLTSCLGDLLPPIVAEKTYVQRRHYVFWTLCRFMPELMYNFLGAEDFFEGLHIADSDYYQKFYSGSRYIFPNNMIVGLCGTGKGGAWQKRAWPYFEELAAQLRKQGYEVRSYGVENEYISGTENYTNMPLRNSLEHLKECSFVIASDGGLMQLADAMGIPTIAIFGPAGVVKNAPFSEFSRVVHSGLECSPCLWRSEFKSCDRPDCMTNISVEQVLGTFDELKNAVIKANGVATNTSPPVLTIDLFNRETDRLSNEGRHSLLSLGGAESFNGMLASHLAAGWMKLGELARVQEVVDLPAEEKDLTLLQYQVQLARKACRSEEEQYLKDIFLRHPDEATSALALIRFYRRNKKWGLFHDMLSSTKVANDNKKGIFLFEQGLGLLEQGKLVAAENSLKEAKSYSPQLASKVDQLTDTTICRHAAHRQQLTDKDKPSVGVLLNNGELLPETFRVVANIADLYVYYSDELESFVNDRSCLDILIVDHSVKHISQFDDNLSPLCIDVNRISESDLLGAIQGCPTWPRAFVIKGKKTRAPKRILLLNHHHMQRWEPHGGEFSTCEIVKRLQRLGYEVLVAVPNRKNLESFCEMYDGIPYIIGRHENAIGLLQHAYHTYFPDIIFLHGTPL